MISNNYYYILVEIRELRRNYKDLGIEQKLRLLKLELRLESKDIKGATEFVSKSEKKKEKHMEFLKNNKKKVRR